MLSASLNKTFLSLPVSGIIIHQSCVVVVVDAEPAHVGHPDDDVDTNRIHSSQSAHPCL